METGRMTKKKERRRQECNRKLGGRKAGATERGDRLGGGAGEKGGEEGVPRMAEGKEAPPSHTPFWIPRSPTGSQHLDFGGLEEEREHFGAGGQEEDD